MAFQLTAGSCMRLYNASSTDEDILNSSHTIQFLSIKKVNNNTTNQSLVDRYRIIMSDGINFIQAMLATQLNHMVREDVIGKHTVAVIEKLTCHCVEQKRLLIICALHVLGTPEGKIGEPAPLADSINAAADPATNDQLQHRESGEGNGAMRSLEPRMNLHESTEKNLVTATFELPGLKKEDVNINVHSNRLEISAESKLSSEHEENGYAVLERQFGKLARTIQLPVGVKPEEIKASMEDGVLTVMFPKTASELAPKKISVD